MPVQIFCVDQKSIYILCQTKRWFAFSKIGFCAGTKVFEEALNAVKFLGWLKKFGPVQNVLGPEKGQGINFKSKCLILPILQKTNEILYIFCLSLLKVVKSKNKGSWCTDLGYLKKQRLIKCLYILIWPLLEARAKKYTKFHWFFAVRGEYNTVYVFRREFVSPTLLTK